MKHWQKKHISFVNESDCFPNYVKLKYFLLFCCYATVQLSDVEWYMYVLINLADGHVKFYDNKYNKL